MLKSITCAMAAAIAVSALSVPAFAAEQTKGRAASNTERLRSAGSVFPSRNIKPVGAVVVDLAQSNRDVLSTDEAARLFTLVGHTSDGKEVRKLPSQDIIRSITEPNP